MTAARLAARAVALLGDVAGPVALLAPARARLAAALARVAPGARPADVPVGGVVAFLGVPGDPAVRQALLRGLQARLPRGAPLVVLDHNQPRAWWRRLRAWFCLVVSGRRPARARYPAAREVAALGFTVEHLRFACGERVQLIVARRC